MSATQSNHRIRWSVPAPRSYWRSLQEWAGNSQFWLGAALCLLATTIVFVLVNGWQPAFPYRVRQMTLRQMSARVAFEFEDLLATQEAVARARSKTLCFYANDARALQELRQSLIDSVFQVRDKPVDDILATVWLEFFPAPGTSPDFQATANAESLAAFKAAIADDTTLESFRRAMEKAFIEIDPYGLLENLSHDLNQGSMREIQVYPIGNRENSLRVDVSKVRIAEVVETLRKSLLSELEKEKPNISDPAVVADRVYHWLKLRLPVTLTFDATASRDAADLAASQVETKMRKYEPGTPLQRHNLDPSRRNTIGGDIPLDANDVRLLQAEHQALVNSANLPQIFLRSVIFYCKFLAMFGLISIYLWQRQPQWLTNFRVFSVLVFAVVVTYLSCWVLAYNVEARMEIIPLVMCSMVLAIAFQTELAIMLGMVVALAFTLSHGYDLAEFVALSTGVITSALSCRSIRSRTKSVYIGLITATIVFPVVIGLHLFAGHDWRWEPLVDATWFAGAAGAAGLIMTALFPFLERWFDVQTDISLLELSDPNHPLLKLLVQRAPGTYNHSINVASMAEAAADQIGANGLLCRVGAYFHDIGKMRKPDYFVENQPAGENRHDDLNPSMSTLVIISHVKDGAEMARNHHLPRRIVDLIEQHHGTTVVQFFFHRATKMSSEEGSVTEAQFRYPGPKPQSIEAAVLMLADAIEGASRTLREPTPARIEHLVHEITKKKLDDGQFDDCPITVQQLHTVQMSLIKSLNATYHARIKYPDQQPA